MREPGNADDLDGLLARLWANVKRMAPLGLFLVLGVAVVGVVVVRHINRPERGATPQQRLDNRVTPDVTALPRPYAFWREGSNPRDLRQYDLVCAGDKLDLGTVVQSADLVLWNADVRVGLGVDRTSMQELGQKADLEAARGEVVRSARYDLCR